MSMKILIGTPIHASQDHLIETWLENVSKLEHPTDLLMVDSSPGLNYIEIVRGYCKKYGIKNYKIEHFEYHQENGAEERIGRSREIIRKEVISNDYEVWFNWDLDPLIPPDALDKLTNIMKAGNYMLVSHNPLAKKISRENDHKFSCDLISRNALRRYGFLLEYPDMPNSWYHLGVWLKKRINRDGGRYVELNINNPNHLKKFRNEKSLKLNLGCGKKHLEGFVNIDIQEPCDLRHDLRTPLPFKDNTVDEIFSEGNVISLFSREEWKKLKSEIVRVLRPGGKLGIIFLDFEYILRAFLENKRKRWWWLETIFSGQQNSYEFSKNGFTPDKLIADLVKEGMEKFSVKRFPQQEHVHLVAFKKILVLIVAILISIPRIIWADLAYISAELTSKNDKELSFLTSTPKRGRKYISLGFPAGTSQLNLWKF